MVRFNTINNHIPGTNFCLLFFPVVVTKYPDNSKLGVKGFNVTHSSKLQSVTVEKTRQQEREAGSLICSAEEREQMHAWCSTHFSILTRSRTQARGMVLPTAD